MTKTLKLTNGQAIALYNFIQNKKLSSGDNKKRWDFLKVIEDVVFAYEDKILELNQDITVVSDKADKEIPITQKLAKVRELTKQLKDLKLVENTFEFKDREVFAKVQHIFETVGTDEVLEGQDSRAYSEIEDAFTNVQETE